MIYGYACKKVNEYGLLEMREITIAASADVLREMAHFLGEMAEIMEAGGFSRCSHRHIGSVIKDWDERFPGKDFIVMSHEGGTEEIPTVRE